MLKKAGLIILLLLIFGVSVMTQRLRAAREIGVA